MFLKIFFLASSFLLAGFNTHSFDINQPQQRPALKTIVIDAGHGGKDDGASAATPKKKI
jgi:N-acetylmuramoyl-L-alanine amidase